MGYCSLAFSFFSFSLSSNKLRSYSCDILVSRIFLILKTDFISSDTICDLGGVDELANYGEYSGAPSEQQTYDYAKTILSLMTREKHLDGKKEPLQTEGGPRN